MKKGLEFTIKTVLATLMVAVLMVANPITAEAVVSDSTKTYIQSKEYNTLNSNLKNYLKTDSSGLIDVQSLTLACGTTVYYADANSGVLDARVNQLKKSDDATGQVTQITEDLALNPDTGKAAEILSGVTPIISTFLGLAVVLITLFMTVFSAIDIVYIVFPATRAFLDNADSKTKIQIVTDDAKVALNSASIESGKSPMSTYFGRRVVSYVILSVMLFIILTGNISLITNLALKVVSGLLNVLVSI